MTNANESTRQPGVAERLPAPEFKKVLAPVDFSESSQYSLRYAGQFARQHGSQLTLLHVVEPVLYPTEEGFSSFIATPVDATCDSAKLKLDQWKQEGVPPTVTAEVKLRRGPAYYEITETARELGIDLIIISTHGYTGLKHVLMGSTAERVVRHAPCPVLVVRRPGA